MIPFPKGLVHTPPLAAPPGETPRRALVLAGGGMRVAYQAGVVRALSDHGLRFAHADGTSGGTMNVAMLLSGLTPEEMCERWSTLDVKRFASLVGAEDYLAPWKAEALGDADGIVEHVFPHLGIDPARIRAAGGMAGTFNVCDFGRKTVEAIPHDRVVLELLVAGISLPIFMPAVEWNGSTWTDAVWIKDANLLEAVARGAEELWVVWCIGNTAAYRPGPFNQYVHMIEMSANGALHEELRQIEEINARIRAGETVHGHTRPVRLHLVRPEHPLPLDPDFFFGRITADSLIAMGYADARRYLDSMSPDGLPLTPEVTRMTTPGSPGVTFREEMKGPFALGSTDPEEGRERGESTGTEMVMNGTVTIRDLDRFVSEPEHPGSLVGTLDFAPFGKGIPCGEGVFNLFSPSDDPRTKLMVYELPFLHEGRPYYLAGHKVVRDDPGMDLWKDTTTLFTTLHEGTDKSGPVAGAGVLRLGVADLARLVGTIHAIDADTPGEQAKAVAKFGKFFAGELWDSYAAKAVY